MRILLIALSLFTSLQVLASESSKSVQVPENCIGKLSPCLVRASSDNFEYKIYGYQFKLLKNSILKITAEKEKFEVELLTGSFQISKKPQKVLPFYFAGEELKINSTSYFIKNKQEVKVLDNDSFFITTYVTKQSSLEKKSYEISTKKEFIDNTRLFFADMGSYKQYLVLNAPKWKSAFTSETERQTKVLNRSIASVEKVEEEKRQRSKAKAESVKKTKNEFFYRTFER